MTDPKNPNVYIIILNWNGWVDTIECLKSLQKITYLNFQIVVVDNHSTDCSYEKLSDWANDTNIPLYEYAYDRNKGTFSVIDQDRRKSPPESRLSLIRTQKNYGYAGGNNVGIRFAFDQGADYFFILNNDTVVDPGVIEPLIDIASHNQNAGILGPKIYFYHEPTVIQTAGSTMNLWTGRANHIGSEEIDIGQYDKTRIVDWVSGAALFVSRKVLIEIGLFDESFYLCYEENDLCHRAKNSGFLVLAAPQAKLWHKAKPGPIKPWMAYYLTRNRLAFMRKNSSIWQFYFFSFVYLLSTIFHLFLNLLKGDFFSVNAITMGFFHGFALLGNTNMDISNYGLRYRPG